VTIEPELTADLLRARLAGTHLADDPLDIVMPPGSHLWPTEMRAQLADTLKPAGVLIPVMQRREGLALLLTQRSAELTHHAGQVSFPGGRMEEADPDVRAAALREAHEEVGIEPQRVAVLGYLQAMPTITGYAVTPVVGLVEPGVRLVTDPTEVEYAFEVPLAHLLDQRNERLVEREFYGRRFAMVEFHYQGERIWGATAHMILTLKKKLIYK